MVIVAVLVVVVVVAAIGAYVFVFFVPGAPGRTSALTLGTTYSTGTATGAQGYQNYKGNFTYANPLGPFGINDSSGKPIEWNSTQSASGSFTFSLNPATYLGSGQGTGTITVTTRGYCTGAATVQYSFKIDVAHPPGQNFQISFNTPTPSNVTVQLKCQGSTKGFNTADNPISFLSVFPNLVSVTAIPATQRQAPTSGVSYTIEIVKS